MDDQERVDIIANLESELNQCIDEGKWRSWEPAKKWQIIEAVSQWLKTNNPYFMDYAWEMVVYWDAPITKIIKAQTLSASYLRRDNRANGTWLKVHNWVWETRTFTLMQNLTLQGLSLKDAAEKAASWVQTASNGSYSVKASTLDKRYSAEIRATGREAEFYKTHIELNGARAVEWNYEWQTAVEQIPDLPPFMKGERR